MDGDVFRRSWLLIPGTHRDEFVHFQPGALENIGMPRDQAKFLAGGVLTNVRDLEITFSGNDVVPPLLSEWIGWDWENTRLAKGAQSRLRVLGSDRNDNPFVIDPENSWEIAWLDMGDEFLRRHVNKSVFEFAHCLYLFRKHQYERGNPSGGSSEWLRGVVRTRIAEIDPTALTPGTYWRRRLGRFRWR